MGPLTVGEIESYRRSLAMSPSLTRPETERLLDQIETLIAERDRAIAVLERLAPAFAELRHALNDLHHSYHPE